MAWLDHAAFVAVVEAATRAPSMLNTQPWRFRLGRDQIDVLVDPQRRLARADPTGVAARIACGAALLNLRLALAVRGTPGIVRLQPDRTDPYLVARLTPDTPCAPTPVEVRLYRAIPARHSNRTPFLDQPVPVTARGDLIAAARAEDAWLDLLIGPAAVEATAGLVRAAHEVLERDAGYRAELSTWVRAGTPATQLAAVDGVPVGAGGPAPRPYELLPRRDFGGEELPSHRQFERDPLIAVLGGNGDWPADQIQAGQALQRVWLTATDLGLAASLFSQPIEVPSVREQLRLALGRHAAPQMVMRFGYAVPAPASPRRPVTDVIVGDRESG
ncbi:nitroreductase [Planosporangium thailandense]|uniref:Nitroreductase n=1 Tax=Planosporangium thailandense TaxID=765197 RepID=A0ABX0Y7D7_9ACTN|nr:nitroreductase family protein [Planosporangium thailandense]NJC73317.1 nitroreductase [Planosporangium thailandense]